MATNRGPMRFPRLLGWFCLSTLLLGTGCDSAQPPIETRWRFVGLQTLAQQTNAPALAAALKLPEFNAARGPLVQRISATLWEAASGNTNLSSATRTALEPVAFDLAERLSLGEILRDASGKQQWALAIQGDAARAQAWQAGWTALFQGARGTGSKAAVVFQGGWIVAVSDAALTPTKSILTTLAQIPVEPSSVLHLDGSLAGLGRYQIDAAAKDGAVRTTGQWNQDKAFPSPLPAWERPAFIRDPLVHLTAARAVSGWVSKWTGLKDVLGSDVPDQVFVWGKAAATSNTPPLQTYLAARVAKPESWIERAYQAAQPFYPAPPAAPLWLGQLVFDAKRHQASIAGFPPINLAPGADDNRSYVVLGMMPQGPSKLGFPKELAAQIERPDVLFYQWENSAEAMGNFTAIAGASDILRFRQASIRRPGIAWAGAASALLNDSVTEAHVTGPTQLAVKRKSSAGLTASELILFARWIDGASPPRPRKHPTAQ